MPPEPDADVRRALVQYAFMRWESAVIIGGTILLTFFLPQPLPGWPLWGWPVLGTLALAAIVASTLTDARARVKVQQALFRERFDPHKILDPTLREEVEQALAYQRRIREHLARQSAGLLKDRLRDITRQLEDWVRNIYRLAERLDAYRHDALLAEERASVPQQLETLRARLEQEDSPETHAQLSDVIEGKRKHWESLRALDERMEQAELQLEQSNTALATVYSQIQLIDAQDVQSGRSERLRESIDEQVGRLQDLVHTINEVYDYGFAKSAPPPTEI